MNNNWYKKFAQQKDTDDWFKKLTDSMPKLISKDEPIIQDTELTLWRGFYGPLSNFDQTGDTYTVYPEKGEQGAIWFTHKLITGYDPMEYATSHGDYLLTYPLQCKKHIQMVHFDDGSQADRIPGDFYDLANQFEDSRYYMGYELLEDWYFSYKHEKFIICKKPLVINKEMIEKI